jgi:biotin operon repressor
MRTNRPIDLEKATVSILLLITQQIGKPCPTRNQIMAQTGLARTRVWPFMDELRKRGLIDIEERAIRPGNWRRLRIVGGEWTDWTQRRVRRRRFPLEPIEGRP